VGLDIGTSGVRAAELRLGRSGATLERFGQVALPPGAVRDGEVVDVDAVADAVKQLWAQAKFSTKKVVVGVANQKVVVRQVDLPWLPAKELRQGLAYQVQDYIPMPVEHAILDLHPLEEFTTDDGTRMLRVLLVAASRTWSATPAGHHQAGLTPTMVDLTSFAVLRSQVTSSAGFAVEAEALVDIGASVTNIVIHQGGVPRFVRILLMGGGDITDAVAERLGLSTDQAESIKQHTGLSLVSSQAESHPAIAPSSRPAAPSSRRSAARSTTTWPSPAQRGSAGSCLSGGGSRLAGLVERLTAATRLPGGRRRTRCRAEDGQTG
jgi:type IV pilus assembly protein PilM